MPAKAYPDGPVCLDPEAVAKAWEAHPVLAHRGKSLERLVQPKPSISEDGEKPSTMCQPSKPNMIHNAALLEVLALDMSKRMRVGAHPIDVVCKMTLAFYNNHPLYGKVVKDFNLKTWAYNDAWTLHRMISQFRGPVAKYNSTRVICLTFIKYCILFLFNPIFLFVV